MFGFSWHKKSRLKRKSKQQRQPVRQPQPQRRRPDIGEVYMMLCRTKDALDMIPDPDLARAKCAMNTLEDLLWQAVNPR